MPFILRKPSGKTTKTPIMFTYHMNGRRVMIATGEMVAPIHWNPVKHRPRTSAPNSAILSAFLDRIERRASELHLDMKAKGQPITPDLFKRMLIRDIMTQGVKETLVDYYYRWLEEMEGGSRYKSLKSHRSHCKLLEAFPGPKDFDDITPRWFERYQKYLEGKGYAANYIGKSIKNIREVMRDAAKEGLTHNVSFSSKDYVPPAEQTEFIYLTAYELLKMYGVDLPPYLDRVRNRHIIAGFTALRFSDTAKITWDSFRDGFLYDRNLKTGTDVVVPVHWVVKQIMEDHPEGLPPAISNQKTNKFLKEIGKRAGINQQIQITRTVGGAPITDTKPKYEWITSHTFRRSAATNMYLEGIPVPAIMKITGHKTEQAFFMYIRVSKEESARHIADSSYFSEL